MRRSVNAKIDMKINCDVILDENLKFHEFGTQGYLNTTRDKMWLPIGTIIQIDVGKRSYQEWKVIDWMTAKRARYSHRRWPRLPKWNNEVYDWQIKELGDHGRGGGIG